MKNLRTLASPDGRAIFVALPPEQWVPIPEPVGCCCRYCSSTTHKRGEQTAFWDTLVVPVEPDSRTMLCHYPELHGTEAKKLEV